MVSFEKPNLPKVLCIDELKGNAEIGKHQCIIVDGKHHKVIDILPDRTFSYFTVLFFFLYKTGKKASRIFCL